MIPDLMGIVRNRWERGQAPLLRLAGVSRELLQAAVSAFLLEVNVFAPLFISRLLQIIAGHGPNATRFCNKDPLTLSSAVYMAEMFPHARFMLMLRDARATVHSMITRSVPVVGFDRNSPEVTRGNTISRIKPLPFCRVLLTLFSGLLYCLEQDDLRDARSVPHPR